MKIRPVNLKPVVEDLLGFVTLMLVLSYPPRKREEAK